MTKALAKRTKNDFDLLREQAKKRAVDLGHALKPFSQHDSLESSSCERCGMTIYVDWDLRFYKEAIEGPASRHRCSVR